MEAGWLPRSDPTPKKSCLALRRTYALKLSQLGQDYVAKLRCLGQDFNENFHVKRMHPVTVLPADRKARLPWRKVEGAANSIQSHVFLWWFARWTPPSRRWCKALGENFLTFTIEDISKGTTCGRRTGCSRLVETEKKSGVRE